MNNFFINLEFLLGSYYFLITTNLLSFGLKAYLLYLLCSKTRLIFKPNKLHFYLFIILIGAMFEDFSWIFLFTQKILFPNSSELSCLVALFIIRIAWIFYALVYQTLALFLENLSTKDTSLNFRQKITISCTIIFCFFLFSNTIINANSIAPTYYLLLTELLFSIYAIFILIPQSLFFAFRNINTPKTPRILKKQFKVLLVFIITRLLSDVIQYYPFSLVQEYLTNSYAIIGLSTTFLTVTIYLCARKITGLRFLNFQNHVQEHHRYNFVDSFKDTLEDLAKASSIKELGHITQTFFKEAFDTPGNRVSLYLRTINPVEANPYKIELTDIETHAELFLNNHNTDLEKCVNKVKILIYDEIDFNNFYDPNYADQTILSFMDTIGADIFLPIYKNHSIIGYIIVERYARLHEFYSHIERDEMLVYASYLGNIINLLQNRNLDSLLYQEKELKEELYKKHQEINQYKESLHSFIKNSKHKEIGIIFYKQRHFVFANQASKEIIKININTNQGSPLTKALKLIATQVEEYKSPQSCITKNSEGERIVISGVPNLEKNHVIITVYYPDFSDILTSQINHLKDPSLWDYLLYLETTKPGQLINQLIPGSGQQLLPFKISLLQVALSKKALLLEMAPDDLMPTVELLHHISMRTILHILTLQGPSKNQEITIKLFGINPIFGINHESDKPLLEKLNGNGTLFIQNIEFMELETQDTLAEFLKYGYYRIFKSDQKMASSARIICSTNQNLEALVNDGVFSPALFNELKKTSLSMPSLLTLPETELTDLACGLAEQAVRTEEFKNLLDLNLKDKTKIIESKPASLSELKIRVQQLLLHKSRENKIDQEIHFDPAYEISDPDLVQASRLGKHALRDPKIMVMLWNKFKNQNKIATFLGVNRSSVNRRIKEYNLEM